MDSTRTTEWRHYRIRPVSNCGASTSAVPFYAPTLDLAFAEARATWPWATEWECLGIALAAESDDQSLMIRKPA